MIDYKSLKAQAEDVLRSVMADYEERLLRIDPRLWDYVLGVGQNTPDEHNLYEILGVLKFLRLLDTYPYEISKVHHAIRLYEGRWEGTRYIPGTGGLEFSGLFGRKRYKLTPFQTFVMAALFGPHIWVNTQCKPEDRELMPTEKIGDDGYIYDYRRLCTELILFIPRKVAKTTFGAFLQFYFFFFGDYNSEGYCVANSADQAGILFNLTWDLIHQLDPNEKRIRFTSTEINWRPGQPRAAKIEALSAGGKTKDGLFAQVCSADEFGSAFYVKGHSDMSDLVNVVEGSMGPRREPLTIITTTAGKSINGPFQIKLDGVKVLLHEEIGYRNT